MGLAKTLTSLRVSPSCVREAPAEWKKCRNPAPREPGKSRITCSHTHRGSEDTLPMSCFIRFIVTFPLEEDAPTDLLQIV